MSNHTENDNTIPALVAGHQAALICVLGGIAVALACLALSSPARAATYEQTGVFGGSATPLSEEEIEADEEIQLGGAGALAVNRTGAGGVPAGTVYAAARKGEEQPGGGGLYGTRVAMYVPKAGGGLEFAEAWEVRRSAEPYVVCGPEAKTLPSGSPPGKHPACRTRAEAGTGGVGIGIDQTTGQVYVYGGFSSGEIKLWGGKYEVIAFSADGGEEVTRFGELGLEGKSIAESPEQVHGSTWNSLAVNSATGDVYVYDQWNTGDFYRRLMVFGPSAGDRSEYEYLGEVLPHKVGDGEVDAKAPVFDDAGHLFVGGIDEGGDNVEEYAAPTPAPYPAPEATPICSFHYEKGGMLAMTVDPATGEPFFYSYKRESQAHWVRQLGPCKDGTFQETGKIAIAPERGDLSALVVDPERQANSSRGEGILYGATATFALESGPGELGGTALGYVFGASNYEPHPPRIEAESFDRVTANGAVLRASIDPAGFPSRYVFQYETRAQYEANPPEARFQGASEAPLGGGLIGGGSEAVAVATQVVGLLPGTEYRFRAVATNHGCAAEPGELCSEAGEAIGLRTFPALAPGLPDGRAYELVSPTQKHGGQVLPADPTTSSCGENACKPGQSVQHYPMLSAPGGNAVVYEGTNFGLGGPASAGAYVARRTAAGWQSVGFSPDLLATGGESGYKSFSTDLSAAVLAQPLASPALSPAAPAGYAELYAQSTGSPLAVTPLSASAPPHRSVGEFKLNFAAASADGSRVFFAANDALTGPTASAPAAGDGGATKFNLYEWHDGSLALVNVLPGNAEAPAGASFATASANTVSADGKRAFFSAESGQVYVREDGERTLQVPDPGSFLSAAVNGSRVLLADGALYDLETESLMDLTEGMGGFQGIVGQDEGLSRVYFVDTEVLDATSNGREEAEPGEDNLYAWAEGQATRFVAQLAPSDNLPGLGEAPVASWAKVPATRTAEASPDGRFLAFLSRRTLTGADNVGPCESNHHGGYVEAPCPEVFVYDSATGRLACASCNPSGAGPLGESVLRRILRTPFGPQPRYLTNSGRLYFDSRDSLVPADTNEGREDVYEWQPQGVGSCASDFADGGCVALISAGHEPADSNLVAVDESGANVFFTTQDRLALRDKDELIDLYDAREGGGIASESETQRTECQGEACQPPVSAPNDPTPGSTTFEGAGNVKEQKAQKRKPSKAKHKKRHRAKHKKHRRQKRHSKARANRHHGGAK